MPTFKVGDRVRATKNCSGAKKGEVYEVEKDDRLLHLKGTACNCTYSWQPFDTTLVCKENLVAGETVIEHKKYHNISVLDVFDLSFIGLDTFTKDAHPYSFQEMQNHGWKIKLPTPPPTATIEIDGKKYNKADVAERVKKLKEVE